MNKKINQASSAAPISNIKLPRGYLALTQNFPQIPVVGLFCGFFKMPDFVFQSRELLNVIHVTLSKFKQRPRFSDFFDP